MKLGFIGTGNMAGAIMGGIIKKRGIKTGRDHRFGYFGSRERKGTFSLWNLCDR